MDGLEPGERMEPGRPLVELAGRLRSAQHEDAEHGYLVVAEPERVVEELSVLRRAAPRAARESRPAAAREPLERVVDLVLVVRHDGVAIRRLIARQAESVERERVLVGRRPLLLQQAAEHAQLDRIGVHG